MILLSLLVLLLTAFGLVVLMSAGKSFKAGDKLFIFKRQAIYLPVALFAGGFLAWFDLDKLRAHVWKIYAGACALLAGVLIFGREVKGSRRWIDLHFVNLQPSDLGKIALVLALSHYLASNRRWFSDPRPTLTDWRWNGWREWRPRGGKIVKLPFFFLWPLKFLRPSGYVLRRRRIAGCNIAYPVPGDDATGDFVNGFVRPALIIGLVCLLIVREPDLGTTILCGAVGAVLLFVAGVRHLYVWPAVATVVSVMSYVVWKWPNRLARVTSFLNNDDPLVRQKEGWQLFQGRVGFAVGGVDGVGLGHGMQQQFFLPEAHTDFVFAIVGEELGLRVTLAVLAVFLLLFGLVMANLRRQQDVFRFNICLGATLFIVLQAIINMGVVTGCLPTKGMSLPFISYGGTNLVMMFALSGLILNCMRTGSRILPSGPREIS